MPISLKEWDVFPTSETIMNKARDNNVNEICNEFVNRAEVGFAKYGVTTERTDLEFDQWIQHLKEELMDSVVYIHRLQKERHAGK